MTSKKLAEVTTTQPGDIWEWKSLKENNDNIARQLKYPKRVLILDFHPHGTITGVAEILDIENQNKSLIAGHRLWADYKLVCRLEERENDATK